MNFKFFLLLIIFKWTTEASTNVFVLQFKNGSNNLAKAVSAAVDETFRMKFPALI